MIKKIKEKVCEIILKVLNIKQSASPILSIFSNDIEFNKAEILFES